ncbi:DMT family transporter [Niameybacter massiliensis]|uniref:DMT family transporter n=1 Tax=Holtiella tumoricola TaxID=3018743 RepID=A0AA42J019_9FIRM|nr:DMT family transporter [Holtiella tumoricola]MDA3731012.1 DMT family transporter [Holtiella tumoricola]
MYTFLSLFVGMIIAIMVAINGELTAYYGMFMAAIIIHIVGSLFAYLTMKLTKQNLQLNQRIPLWFYLGGALGVVTTFCNNFAFGKISLTSIIAIGLLGQTLTSLLIDSFGLFGMKKYPFQKYTLIGLSLALLGMIMMLDSSTTSGLLAVLLSFIAGLSIVASRTCNARLADRIGILPSSLVNHLVGLPLCIVLFLALDTSKLSSLVPFTHRPWIYLGGVLGVATVLLFNLLVPKVAALPLTILSFIGQIFTSMVLDLVLLHTYDATTFVASLVIALGIAINMFLTLFLSTKQKN